MSVITVLLVGVLAAQLSAMIGLSNYNIADNAYAQRYSTNFEQAASLVNNCSGDDESSQICVNNNPQMQGKDNNVNTPINSQIINPVEQAPKQVLQVRTVEGPTSEIAAQQGTTVAAPCADDELATGGGYRYAEGAGETPSNVINFQVRDRGTPANAPSTWAVDIVNPGPETIFANAFVECAKLVDAP